MDVTLQARAHFSTSTCGIRACDAHEPPYFDTHSSSSPLHSLAAQRPRLRQSETLEYLGYYILHWRQCAFLLATEVRLHSSFPLSLLLSQPMDIPPIVAATQSLYSARSPCPSSVLPSTPRPSPDTCLWDRLDQVQEGQAGRCDLGHGSGSPHEVQVSAGHH